MQYACVNLKKSRPSIYGNSFVVAFIHIATFALGVTLIGMYIMKMIDKHTSATIMEWLGGIKPITKTNGLSGCQLKLAEQQQVMMSNVLSHLYLATGILMLFINRLTAMIGRRNVFLMEFVEVLDDK